ncbi:MAG: phage tail length tape measure family protein [Aeromonadaceae bacterium]
MAEQVGSIEYSVRFEVAEVLASSKTFEKSLDQVESAAAKADKMIAELSKETSGLGTKMTATAAGVKAATSGMGNMRGMAQNLGYQLQDVAVQAQMGASWFTIIGQQGSQLLSAIGPAGAIAGALLAVGAAAGSALAPSLMKAKDSAADLEVALDDLKKVVGTTADDTDVLTERVLKLAAANREAAKTEVALGITKAKDAIAASSDIIGEAITKADGWTNATGSMSKAVSQLPALTQIMDRFGVSQAEALDGNIPAEFQRRIEALSTYIGTLGEEFGMTRSQALQFVQAADEFTRLKTPEAATKLATTINSINEANGYANRSLVELGAAVGENTRTMQDAADKANILTSALSGIEQAAKQSEEAIARNSSAIKGLIESATMEAETIGKSDRARALYVAGLAKATEAEIAQINAQYDKIEAFEKSQQAQKEAEASAKKSASESESAQKKLESQYQANENSLKRMAQQLTIAGLSTQGLARDAAQLAAAYSLGENATEAQINQARELAGALFDLNEQKKRENELESQKKQAEQFTKQVAFDSASPLEKIDIEEQAKLAKLQEYQDAQLLNEQAFQTARNQIIDAAAMERQQIETARNSMILGASADFFGGMADLTGAFAGEQSGAYKALFAISKGFAIANAALQLQTAIANASALPWPANLPAIGQAVALGGQIASSISGISYGGGRQFGGPVNPGSMYRVGEGNAPELLSVGGSNYMIPGSRGQVTPLDGASGGVTFNITNNASDMVQTQQSYDPETRTVELAITAVANQINSRTGKVGAAMKGAGAYNRLG